MRLLILLAFADTHALDKWRNSGGVMLEATSLHTTTTEINNDLYHTLLIERVTSERPTKDMVTRIIGKEAMAHASIVTTRINDASHAVILKDVMYGSLSNEPNAVAEHALCHVETAYMPIYTGMVHVPQGRYSMVHIPQGRN
jgi:hypothetical protein